MTTLFLTNGDSTVSLFREAGISDPILPWRDVLHEGRVTRCRNRAAFGRMRSAEIATAFGQPIDNILNGFEERENTIRDHAAFDRIEIWLEHDLYDQLQLLDMLDALDAADRHDDVHLVQADDYLGHQTPDTILNFSGIWRPVSTSIRNEAAHAWDLFCGDDCAALAEYACAEVSAPALLPWLRPALRRFLAEYPDTANGLSRTQRRALETLEHGAQTVGKTFGAVSDREEAMFMGDLSFFRIVDALASASAPAIKGLAIPIDDIGFGDTYRAFAMSEVSLTDFGRELFDGEADFITENGIDCWFGGHRAAGHDPWRWDESAQALVPPKGKS